MSDQTTQSLITEEVAALKQKYENLKSQTEEFISTAKHLSESGVHGAKEVLESAKENWQTILSGFGGATVTQLFTQAKAVVKKQLSATAKKAGKKAKGKVKKIVKKAKKVAVKAKKKKK